MKFSIVSKTDCPFCDRAKALLAANGYEYEEIVITDLKGLQEYYADAETVPQVADPSGNRIGGYTDLVTYFEGKKTLEKHIQNSPELLDRVKTVFNVNNSGHEDGKYPLFLGEDLGFIDTINSPYPILDQLYQKQVAQIWNEFEIDLTQDRNDMITAPKAVVDTMVKTIMWQHLADSVASRCITGILMDYVTNSDLEGWYNVVAFFETIHGRTYSHIIKQTFVDPNEALRQGYKDMEVIKRSDILRNAFDDLGNLPLDTSKEEARPYLYKALVALYALESLNFMASFAITFGIAETGIFQGISQNVALICRDEMLHAKGGKEILEIEKRENPKVWAKILPELQDIVRAVIETEKSWTDHLFSDGREILGVNPERVKQYVDYAAMPVKQTLDMPFEFIEKNPLPYMDVYVDSTKTQVAAQELQLNTYLVNSVAAVKDLSGTLAKLRKKHGI